MTTKEKYTIKNQRRRQTKKLLGKQYAAERAFRRGLRSVIGSDGKPYRAINGAYGNISSPEIIVSTRLLNESE